MAISNLGTNAPNGTVGVSGWMRNGESNRWTPGTIIGFTPVFNGLAIQPAAGWKVNYAQAVNGNGDVMILGSNTADMTSLQLSAPTTSGQSIVYAIVASVDANATTTANNGVGLVSLLAIPGAAATTGSAVAPSDAQIRQAIPNGATAFVAVVMTVTVAYGQNSLSTGNVSMNWSQLKRAAPRIYQGTAVIRVDNSVRSRLITESDLTTILGHRWSSDTCSASVMNGDYYLSGTQSAQAIGVDYDGACLNVTFNTTISGLFRVNWSIVDSTNAGEK